MAITAGYGNAKFVDDAQVCGLFFIFFISFRPKERERETESRILIDFFPAGLSLSLSVQLSNFRDEFTTRASVLFPRSARVNERRRPELTFRVLSRYDFLYVKIPQNTTNRSRKKRAR